MQQCSDKNDFLNGPQKSERHKNFTRIFSRFRRDNIISLNHIYISRKLENAFRFYCEYMVWCVSRCLLLIYHSRWPQRRIASPQQEHSSLVCGLRRSFLSFAISVTISPISPEKAKKLKKIYICWKFEEGRMICGGSQYGQTFISIQLETNAAANDEIKM